MHLRIRAQDPGMEKGRVDRGAGERRSRSPQARKEPVKPMSAVEEVIKEPQYVVDREKVRSSRCQVFIPIRTHQHMALCTSRDDTFILLKNMWSF